MKRLWIVGLTLVLFLIGCSEKLPIETNMSEKVRDFTFTTQDEGKLGLEDLKGKWWIADFIFTNCTTVCLPMTSNMSQLQDKLKEEQIDIQLISFSVDPEYDTPEVLTEYGHSYNADFSNWAFLTGYDFDTIANLSVKSFRAAILAPGPGSDQVSHDTRFFLVSPEGKVVKGYNGVNFDSIDEVIEDLKVLKEEGLL